MNTSYQNRRHRLGGLHPRTLFLISSGRVAARSHSVNHRFKTAGDFSYLTGLDAAEGVLLVLDDQAWLFSREENEPQWGEDHVIDEESTRGLALLPRNALVGFLEKLQGGFDRIAMPINRDRALQGEVLDRLAYRRRAARSISNTPSLVDSSLLVGRLRLLKEPQEIELLREAGLRSSRVHELLRSRDLAGLTEREVANWIEAQFLLAGLEWPAYQTIVGSGARATILHARPTDRVIGRDELVLIDAGGEWRGYCADITRVFPAGGGFSDRQFEIYQVVLRAQREALKLVAPGASLSAIHLRAAEELQAGLEGLGLAREKLRNAWAEISPHFTSHWIGRDVHDPSPHLADDGSEIVLQPGMCLTVEPGLYFRDGRVSAAHEGIGVRIEDNVVVTVDGHENLTTAPKDFP